MTNSSDRLDRIEVLIERLSQRVDSNAKAIQANSVAIAEVNQTLSEAVGRTLRAVDELKEIVAEDRVNFQEFVRTTQATLVGINATIERQDRILDYLLRRERNGNGGG